MGCGLPVIIPRGGAADDFTSEDTVFHVPARWMKAALDVETVRDPIVLNVDTDQLADKMRHVFRHRDEARAKGLKASEAVQSLLTWERSAEAVLHRLRHLKGKPIRRFQGSTARSPERAPEQMKARSRRYNRRGLAFCTSGNPERAELEFLRSLQVDPDFAEPHNNLAVLYWERGRFKESLTEIAEALRLAPDNPDVLSNIERMSCRGGRQHE